MAVRERLNKILVEISRLNRVPINSAETIYQGDALAWDTVALQATKLVSTASAVNFIGIAEHSNPVETAGSHFLLPDQTLSYMPVIRKARAQMIAGEVVTLTPFQLLTIGADSQTVLHTGANSGNKIAYVDPSVGTAGKAFAIGDLIPVLVIPAVFTDGA